LDQLAEAWAVCHAGHVHYPHDTELLFLQGLLEGQLCHQRGDLAGARRCWTQLLEKRFATATAPTADNIFRSIDTGVRDPLARQHLAWLDYDEGRFADAENHWRTILAEMPSCMPARLGLAELYLQQRRWGELVDQLNILEAHGLPQAVSLRARMNQVRQEFNVPMQEAIGAEQTGCVHGPHDATWIFTAIAAADASEQARSR
jgi:hypothetical protein